MKINYTARIKQIKNVLRKKNIAALLIIDPANVNYLSSHADGDALILITKHHQYLITEGRYILELQKKHINYTLIQHNGQPLTKIKTLAPIAELFERDFWSCCRVPSRSISIQ